MQPALLTIILNFRTPDMTLRAAETALREMADLSGEVLVIDNGSGDDSFEVMQREAQDRGWLSNNRFRLISSDHNGGFGAGVNIGLRARMSDGRRPDYYYLLNSDAFPEPGAVRILLEFLTSNPQAGMAGSYIRGVDGEPHRTAFRFPSIAGEFEAAAKTGVFSRLLKHAIVAIEIPKNTTQVDWTAGASLMIRRDLIEKVGGFDETFFLYFEETDLCHRARQAGWQVYYLPGSEVAHVGSASTGMKTWDRVPQYWLDSRLHYFTKTHGRLYAAGATLSAILGGILWRLRCMVQNKPLESPPHFLRDLMAHSVRHMFRRAPRISDEFPLSTVATEDNK
ncbi:MAG: glycosyltransferase [Rhodobacteraceae bacterium]|nr:glycosyltransferase [Paracoccaceae bacterium]